VIENNWLDRYLLANDPFKDRSRNVITHQLQFFM